MLDRDELADAIRLLGRQDDEPLVRLGTVDAGQVISTATEGHLSVVFDGESAATARRFRYVTPAVAGDRVVLLRSGNSWVVLGPLNAQGSVRHMGTRYIATGSLNTDSLPTGVYSVHPDVTGIPHTGGWWLVLVLRHTAGQNNYTRQLAFDIYSGEAYSRRHGGGLDGATASTWTPWERWLGGDTDWHTIGAAGEPAFLNGWAAFTADAQFGTPGFRKAGDNLVTMRGLASSEAATATGVLVLPAGYRPARHVVLPSVSSGTILNELRVLADGQVQLLRFGAGTGWGSLACTFYAG